MLSNKQIAHNLDISEKTVENQMGRAIKYLRSYMSYTYAAFLILLDSIFSKFWSEKSIIFLWIFD